MPDMKLDYLTWEAFATMFAGILAISGALGVGWLQLRILQRQTDLGELTLRVQVFDDRHEVYLATREWLAHILTTASLPGRTRKAFKQGQNAPGADTERAFLEAIDKARFLFRPAVFDHLERLWVEGNALHYHQTSQDVQGEDRSEHIDKEFEVLRKLFNAHRDLSLIFGEEMRLSAHPSTFRPLRDAPEWAGGEVDEPQRPSA